MKLFIVSFLSPKIDYCNVAFFWSSTSILIFSNGLGCSCYYCPLFGPNKFRSQFKNNRLTSELLTNFSTKNVVAFYWQKSEGSVAQENSGGAFLPQILPVNVAWKKKKSPLDKINYSSRLLATGYFVLEETTSTNLNHKVASLKVNHTFEKGRTWFSGGRHVLWSSVRWTAPPTRPN